MADDTKNPLEAAASVDTSNLPIAPGIPLTPRLRKRLADLRAQLIQIQQEIRALGGHEALVQPWSVHCLRCGYKWIPHSPFVPPMTCTRCGSAAWNRPPTAKSRRPEDPPSPGWRPRKNTKRKIHRVFVPVPDGYPLVMAGDPVPFGYVAPVTQAQLAAPKPDSPGLKAAIESLNAPSQAERMALSRALRPPWEEESALPPPPPLPFSRNVTYPPAPFRERFADAPTPESQASQSAPAHAHASAHAPAPAPAHVGAAVDQHEFRRVESADSIDEFPEELVREPQLSDYTKTGTITVDAKFSPEVEAYIESAKMSLQDVPADIHDTVPAETIGQPRSQAEQEELERARSEAWPTTKGDE